MRNFMPIFTLKMYLLFFFIYIYKLGYLKVKPEKIQIPPTSAIKFRVSDTKWPYLHVELPKNSFA